MQPPTKHCGGCGRMLPLTDFRRRRKNSDALESRCRECHRDYMRWYRRVRRQAALRQFVGQAKWRTDESVLAAMCEGMIAQFGGLDAMCRSFVDYTRNLAKNPATAAKAVDCYSALFRMMAIAEKAELSRAESLSAAARAGAEARAQRTAAEARIARVLAAARRPPKLPCDRPVDEDCR